MSAGAASTLSQGLAKAGDAMAKANSGEPIETGLVTAAVSTAAANNATGTLETARDFLARAVPWPVNGVGHVNVHYSFPDPRGGKDIVTGKPFQDIDQLLGFCKWAQRNNNNIKELWYCTSLQSHTATNSKGGLKAVRLRQNAIHLKAIWVDIDVGNTPEKRGKHYDTHKEAWNAICKFRRDYKLPQFSAAVNSGGGLHVYWISKVALEPAVWQPFAEGLKALLLKDGIKCDSGLTTDSARILRIPGTLNHKYDPPRPVQLEFLERDYDFAIDLALLKTVGSPQATSGQPTSDVFDNSALVGHKPILSFDPNDSLSAGLRDEILLDPKPILAKCGFLQDAFFNNGRDYENPLWNLTLLCATFLENGNWMAHEMSKGHPKYTFAETQTQYERKLTERQTRGSGYPQCSTIHSNGCTACGTCALLSKGKSPLNIRPELTVVAAPAIEPLFVDPYAEFVGSPFPTDVLPPTLAKFVDAEHKAMGADPSAIALAALTALAGAMHAETKVRVGDGWWEKPIMWCMLIGQPSSMKSPVIDKAFKPLSAIDNQRDKLWRQEHAVWQKNKIKDKKLAAPPKPPRCLMNDSTSEKIAEILSRGPNGSMMVQDELSAWFASFERYNSGSSRGFMLSCWNGGTFLKDRVGKGKQDADAEIRVDNLALCILGGIQPDLLSKLGDLTSDGLLQRFLLVLMKSAERGDQDYHVTASEADYEQLVRSLNDAPPEVYHFSDDALQVRDRLFDYLHKLEMVDGFPPSLIGAIGKLKGYFARICLVLHVANRHDPGCKVSLPLPAGFTVEARDSLVKLFGFSVDDCLSAGITISFAISHQTAEAAEKLVRDFLLPNCFAFYDFVANGSQERDRVRTIANYILASDLTRLRPSDITAGVRALRGEPEQKIREWVGRFCGMGWLVPEEGKQPSAPPKAWQVVPGLREHFAEKRKKAQAARAEAHAILKNAGQRKESMTNHPG